MALPTLFSLNEAPSVIHLVQLICVIYLGQWHGLFFQTMEVDVDDYTFALTNTGNGQPFGTTRSCEHKPYSFLGYMNINLTGIPFHVHPSVCSLNASFLKNLIISVRTKRNRKIKLILMVKQISGQFDPLTRKRPEILSLMGLKISFQDMNSVFLNKKLDLNSMLLSFRKVHD